MGWPETPTEEALALKWYDLWKSTQPNQESHVTHAIAVALASLLLALAAQSEPWIDTQFGGEGQAVTERSGKVNPRAKGVLPKGWTDNTQWAQIWTTYSAMEEEGRPYTRADFTKVDGRGWSQFAHSLPDLTEVGYFRVQFVARALEPKSVQIGIRFEGRPYTFLWSARPELYGEWKTYSYEFQIKPNTQPIGFWIINQTLGSIDVASLKVEHFTRAKLIADLETAGREAGIVNLLRCSRLPLGLQSGWSIGRDNSDGDVVQIAGDPQVVGPSRAPALRMASDTDARVYCEPFGVPYPVGTYVASLAVRGAGSGTVSVSCDRRTVAKKAFEVKDGQGWQRLHVPFKPKLMAEVYAMVIDWTGTVWIDALQVAPMDEKTGQPQAYAPQMRTEVALALPESDASCARVQFADEPAEVQWCVTGDVPAGAALRGKVTNAYGEEASTLGIALDGKPLAQGKWADCFAVRGRPFGPQRVEAWVEDAAGQRISPYNEIVVYRLPRPHYWGKDAPDSPFGVHTNSTTRHNTMAKAVGINWTRLHDAGLQYIGWFFLEAKPGEWQFRDDAINRYRKHHLMILGELGTAPLWASHYPGKPASGYFDKFYQPKSLTDYANYVRTVTTRYKGVIHAWDVWNEPWITGWWAVGYDFTKKGRQGYIRSETAEKDFVALMRTARDTAKSVAPSLPVLGINTTTGRPGNAWTKGCVEHGGMDHLDAIAYHQYTGEVNGFPQDSVERGYAHAMEGIVEKHGKVVPPVWMTEGQAARLMGRSGMYRHTAPKPSERDLFDAADRQVRYMTSLLASGSSKIFLYSMHGHSHFGDIGQWRALVTDEGYLHPSAAGVSTLAWHMEDTRFVERVGLVKNAWAYLFEAKDESRSVAVLSTHGKVEGYLIPTGDGVSAVDLFNNPIAPGTKLARRVVFVRGDGAAPRLKARLAAD